MHPPPNSRPAAAPKRILQKLQALATPAWLGLLALLFGLRAFKVDSAVGAYLNCRGCFWMPVVGHDLWLLAAASGLLGLVSLSSRGWLQAPLRLAVAVLVVLAGADLLLFGLLTQRLNLGDALKFGGEISANWSVLESHLGSPSGMFGMAIAALFIGLVILGFLPEQRRLPRAAMLAGIAAMCSLSAIAIGWAEPLRHVHSGLVKNVVELNLPQSSVRPFSAGYLATQRAIAAQLPELCERNPRPSRPNVVIVLVESLSAWQSALLGGPQDWTPRLDDMARSSHFFTHFYANGFTTSGAEIAIGSGLPPIKPPGALEYTFSNFVVAQRSLPGLATSAGYRSQFFTSGDTGFLEVGEWLRRIGFDEVHGSEDAYYDGRERWQFHSVEDSIFYDRFLAWLDERRDEKPFISVLLTVSSHPPFVDPATRRIDPQTSFRYVDAQLGRLHDSLEARGFFGQGILIIMGDHRTMTPLQAEEYRRFGERAYARVPMIVVGNVDMPRVIDAAFQQTDLLPSLAWVLGEPWCRNSFAGNFLRPDPKPPAIVVHARGTDRNRVDVYHGSNSVSGYLLDGDDSRWLDTPPPGAAGIAAWIDAQRDDAFRRGSAVAGEAPDNR